MIQLKRQLMHREALQRLHDAETLEKALPLGERSDSPHLLRLLGLELLLKLVFESFLQKVPYGHKYGQLFSELPGPLQARLLALAGERIGPSSLNDRCQKILHEWGRNFVELRYPWERYNGMSEADYSRISSDWVSKGAPLEEATFRYYPEELEGFLNALVVVAGETID